MYFSKIMRGTSLPPKSEGRTPHIPNTLHPCPLVERGTTLQVFTKICW